MKMDLSNTHAEKEGVIFTLGPSISLGEYLIILRRRNEITQEDLAKAAGVAKGTIVSAENDKGTVTLKSLIKIFSAFGLLLFPNLEPKEKLDEPIRPD